MHIKCYFTTLQLHPTASLASLVWVDEAEAAAPHISEMGWTVVPPGMPPQSLHVDFVTDL